MKKSLNVLCIVLVIMMLCACTKEPVSGNNTNTTPPATEEPSGEVKSWDGPIATSFSGGSGTKDDPYQIATAAELAYLASQVNNAVETYKNKYIELTADIDLGGRSWIPIGLNIVYADGQCFMGTFNGNNHTVTNMLLDDPSVVEIEDGAINIGLFGVVEYGTIENLVVSNSNMNYSVSSGDNVRSGIIVGYVADGIVRNCSFVGNITTEHEISDKSKIKDGYISQYLGGVVGRVDNSKVISCHFVGSIDVSTSVSAAELEESIAVSVGGLIGVSCQSWVSECNSSGSINTDFMSDEIENSKEQYCWIFSGGILGMSLESGVDRSLSNAFVTANLDASKVISPKEVYYMRAEVGGIVGRVSVDTNGTLPSVINECVSMGNISIDCPKGLIRSGGLVGCINHGGLVNSYSIGKVTSATEDVILIGGISGTCISSSLENCYSSSRLSYSDSRYAAGGIIGYSEEDGNIVNNCYYQRTATDTNNGIGTPLSKSQMKDPTYYKGFDFDDVWEISDNPEHGYLKLKNVVYD